MTITTQTATRIGIAFIGTGLLIVSLMLGIQRLRSNAMDKRERLEKEQGEDFITD